MSSFTILFVDLIQIISVFISLPIIQYTTLCVFIYVDMIDKTLLYSQKVLGRVLSHDI